MKSLLVLVCTIFSLGLSAQTINSKTIESIQSINGFISEENTLHSGLNANEVNQFDLRYANDALDSLYAFKWDSISFQWQLTTRSYFTHDANNNSLSELSLTWNGAEWLNYEQYLDTYDLNNNLVNEIYQTWNETSWDNSTQTVQTFDADNNRTSITNQDWDGVNWVNNSQQVYTYDSNHNQISRTASHWTGTAWQGIFYRTLTYDADNKLIYLLVQVWNSGWVDAGQTFYTYDVNQDLVSDLSQSWKIDHWEDNTRNFYEYDANHNRTLLLKQLSVDSVWVDQERFFFAFDQNNLILSQLYQTYADSSWVNVYQFLLTNDERQNRVTEVFQVWDSTWVNQDSMHYYYTFATAINEQLKAGSGINLYPNPANSTLSISFAEDLFENKNIEIYSSDGIKRMDARINRLQTKSIDMSHLAPGMYHVLIRSEKGIMVRNFVKL